MPVWLQWLLGLQTLFLGLAGLLGGLAWRSFQVGGIGTQMLLRMDALEQSWKKANPELSRLASRVQGMKTVEELRDVFVDDRRYEDRHAALTERVSDLERQAFRDPTGRTRHNDRRTG